MRQRTAQEFYIYWECGGDASPVVSHHPSTSFASQWNGYLQRECANAVAMLFSSTNELICNLLMPFALWVMYVHLHSIQRIAYHISFHPNPDPLPSSQSQVPRIAHPIFASGTMKCGPDRTWWANDVYIHNHLACGVDLNDIQINPSALIKSIKAVNGVARARGIKYTRTNKLMILLLYLACVCRAEKSHSI